jgi:MarR-like DNA-binding transcriptional regulator SgrR of sgrS sRNA
VDLTLQSEYNELLSKSRSRVLKERENRDTPSPSRNLAPTTSNASPAQPSSSSNDKRWLLRFQELEHRLKAEQEGRALDQKGAKIRLDEVRKENAELRNEIKEKEVSGGGSSSGSTKTSKELKREGSDPKLESLRTPVI